MESSLHITCDGRFLTTSVNHFGRSEQLISLKNSHHAKYLSAHVENLKNSYI